MLLPLVAGLPATLKGGSPFVPYSDQLKDMPLWRRRWSFTEVFAIYANVLLFMYIPTDVLLIADGQYQDGVLGSLGGVLVAVVDFSMGCYYLKWLTLPALGRAEMQVPPGMRIAYDEMQRPNLMKYMYYAYMFTCAPIHVVRGIMQPDELHLHFDFASLTNTSAPLMDCSNPCRSFHRESSFELGIIYAIPIYLLWYNQHRVYRALTAPFERSQRLIDGAFIAALLDDDTSMDSKVQSAGSDSGGNSSETKPKKSAEAELIAETAMLIRRVPMSNVSLAMLRASPRDVSYNADDAYALGESCGLGGIDYFISHSWSDCPRQKYAQLCAVSLEFWRKHKRQPSFWLDKCCIDQSEIERDLRCLPVFVQSCAELLILCGDSYATRLWCVWELYIHFAMAGAKAQGRTKIVNCCTIAGATSSGDAVASASSMDEASDLPGSIEDVRQEGSPASALSQFDVKNAHCFSAADEAKLRRVIESESAESFNHAIRAVASLIVEAEEAGSLRKSRMSRVRSSAKHDGKVADGTTAAADNPLAGAESGRSSETPLEKALRELFVALDENSDGRLCAADLLKAFGGDPQQREQSSGGVLSAAQVEDLLSIINTGPQLHVNGQLSIGLEEFQIWMKRSRG